MKIKTAVAILLLATFALSSIATITIKTAKASGTCTLPDAELMLPVTEGFVWQYDLGSSLTGKTDVAGPGVKFDFAGLGKAGVGDKHPVNQLAGGALNSGHYSDFSGYSEYSMLFINVGSGTIQVCLFMNTGFTSTYGWRDTFWGGNWVTVDPGQSAVATLNFAASGEAWNIADDLDYPGHANGITGHEIFRLNEVTNIGFQVLGTGSASVIASGALTHLYIDPPVVNKGPGNVYSFFDVFVTISDFANLAGFDIKLIWDNNLITKYSVDYATYLTALWGTEDEDWSVILPQSGVGYYRLAVAALATSASNTGASILFKIHFEVERSCNFLLSTAIHFDKADLSDNAQPIPNPIPATVTDGMYYMSSTMPDIEFKVLKYNKTISGYEPVILPGHFEYCNLFRVEVYVSHIHDCSPLMDYEITINFDPGLAVFVGVGVWGIFGPGTVVYTPGTPNVIHVSGNGGPWFGEEGLLFTLTFHVEFSRIPAHIWKNDNPNFASFQIWLADASLSFGSLGNILMSGIITPSPLTFKVYFIRGDVTCNGVVLLDDIGDVAYYYDQTAPPEYDLTNNGIIDLYDIVTIATNFGYSSLNP